VGPDQFATTPFVFNNAEVVSVAQMLTADIAGLAFYVWDGEAGSSKQSAPAPITPPELLETLGVFAVNSAFMPTMGNFYVAGGTPLVLTGFDFAGGPFGSGLAVSRT
jgi:hypothetical protein